MIQLLFNLILKLVSFVLDIVLAPVNLLIEGLFPDMTNAINNFTYFVNTYLGPSLSYFFSILPPITRSVILLWLMFLITYYPIVWTYYGILKIWVVIKRIKIW